MANLRLASNIVNSSPNGFQSWDEVTNQDKWNSLTTEQKIQTKLEYEQATGVTIPEIYGKTGDMIPWEQLSSDAQYQHMSAKDKATTANEYEAAGGFLPWTAEISKEWHNTEVAAQAGALDTVDMFRYSMAKALPSQVLLTRQLKSKGIDYDPNKPVFTPENIKAVTGYDVVPNNSSQNTIRDVVPYLIPSSDFGKGITVAAEEYIPTKVGKWATKKATQAMSDAIVPTIVQDDREGKEFSPTDYALNTGVFLGGELASSALGLAAKPITSRVQKATSAYLKDIMASDAKLEATKPLYAASQGNLFENIAEHLMTKSGRSTIKPNEVIDAWIEANPEIDEITWGNSISHADRLRNLFKGEEETELTSIELQSRITTALAEAENDFLDASLNNKEIGARAAIDAMVDSQDNKKLFQLTLNPMRNNNKILKEIGAGPLYRTASKGLGIGEKGLFGIPKYLRAGNAQQSIDAALDHARNAITEMIDGLTTRIAELTNESRGITGVAKLEHDAKIKAHIEQKKHAKKMLKATESAKNRKINIETLYNQYTEAQQAIFGVPGVENEVGSAFGTQKSVRDSIEEVMNLREMAKGSSLDAGDMVGLAVGLSPHIASLGTSLVGSAAATAGKQVMDKMFIRDLRVARDAADELEVALAFHDEQEQEWLKILNEYDAPQSLINEALAKSDERRNKIIEEGTKEYLKHRYQNTDRAINATRKLGAALGASLIASNP